MRRSFEYSAQDIFGDSPQTDMIEMLNAFGALGWELVCPVAITRRAWGTGTSAVSGQRLLFKREIWEA